MGFLSKLFGGDAKATVDKAVDADPSDLDGSVAARAPAKAPSNRREVETVKSPGNGRREAKAAPSAPRGEGSSASAEERSSSATAEPLGSVTADPSSSAAIAPPSAAPPVQRKAPERPQRNAQIESSIITSAPVLTAEPARAPAAPRPGAFPRTAKRAPVAATAAVATAPVAAPAPAQPRERAPMSSLSGEITGVNGLKTRRDRSKSPGFYSSVSPANGSHAAVGGALNPTNLKKPTVIGLAPPAELPAGPGVDPALAELPLEPPTAIASPAQDAASLKDAGSLKDAASPKGAKEPALAVKSPGSPAPLAAAAQTPLPLIPGAPAADAVAPLILTDSAPASADTDSEEKEDTSPGLGQSRSRHDPALRLGLPEKDVDLLVDFILDLGLGVASGAWLEPVRSATARLKAAAAKLKRTALDKALGQLSVELEAPNALADERKNRILQQFVLVDLALPKPIDVSGQRVVRDRLIVQQLLGELAAAYPLLAQRLREEGFGSLDRFARLSAEELALKLDVTIEQAEQVVGVFQRYLLERSARGPEQALLGKGRALERRLVQLEVSAEQFEQACDGDDSEARRVARRQRQLDVAQLSLLLAERGEASVLAEIERCSVQGKIERLRRWLLELPPSSA